MQKIVSNFCFRLEWNNDISWYWRDLAANCVYHNFKNASIVII